MGKKKKTEEKLKENCIKRFYTMSLSLSLCTCHCDLQFPKWQQPLTDDDHQPVLSCRPEDVFAIVCKLAVPAACPDKLRKFGFAFEFDCLNFHSHKSLYMYKSLVLKLVSLMNPKKETVIVHSPASRYN